MTVKVKRQRSQYQQEAWQQSATQQMGTNFTPATSKVERIQGDTLPSIPSLTPFQCWPPYVST